LVPDPITAFGSVLGGQVNAEAVNLSNLFLTNTKTGFLAEIQESYLNFSEWTVHVLTIAKIVAIL
jgi:hypothetical protein